jgi:hypothetical protein
MKILKSPNFSDRIFLISTFVIFLGILKFQRLPEMFSSILEKLFPEFFRASGFFKVPLFLNRNEKKLTYIGQHKNSLTTEKKFKHWKTFL